MQCDHIEYERVLSRITTFATSWIVGGCVCSKTTTLVINICTKAYKT
jgi:hypothetical protein